MKLRFDELEIEHFRSFSAKQVFKLAPAPGLWFLEGENLVEPQLGSNGSGKSSLWGALCWIIYGCTAKGLRNPDIKPWVGKGVPKGTLRVTIDGQPHTITRVAKTNGLTIDGKECGPGDAAKLIGLSFEAFVNTLYIAQGAPLFFDKTPAEKLQLLTEVLALDRWEERSSKAASKVRELEGLEREMRGELEGLEVALTNNEELITRARASMEEWEREKEARAREAKQKIKTLTAELQTAQKKLDEASLKCEGAWIRLREMREDVKTLRKNADSARRQYAEAEARFADLKRQKARAEASLAELGRAKTCPTCGQPIKQKDVSAHRKEIEGDLEGLEREIGKGISPKVKALYEGAVEALDNFEADLTRAERETDALQSQINVLQPNVQRLKAALAAAQDALNADGTSSNPYAEQLQNLRRQKSQLNEKIDDLREDLQKAAQRIERTKFWVKGFKDVALYLIEEVLVELEAVTSTILGEVGLVGWDVRYAMERETKSGTVKRGITVTMAPPGEGPSSVRWESWSGGEEQRLRIVGAVALSEVLLRHAGISSNLEIFDEPAKFISGAGVQDLCEYLKDRAKSQDKTIWLVDHLIEESSVFAGTVTVQKTKKGSVIS